ncbi:MAG: hypothetical protein ACTHMX_00265 [Thermomicrobiales bacterium]
MVDQADAPSTSLTAAIVDIAGRLAAALQSPDADARIAAISLAIALDRLTDRAVHAIVQEARHAGFSWQQIGDITGTSRQGAFQRFGGDPDTIEAGLALAPLPDAPAAAAGVITAFLEDDWDLLRGMMTKSVAAVLTERRARSIRREIVATLGSLVAIEPDSATVAMMGDMTIVTVPIRFARGHTRGKVSLTPDRRILGFWIDPVAGDEGGHDHG